MLQITCMDYKNTMDEVRRNVDPKVVARVANYLKHATDSITVSGVGKSGLLAERAAATMRSLGLNAHYYHATDLLHGDAGHARFGAFIAVSHSGRTKELIDAVAEISDINKTHSPPRVIAVTSNPVSPLATMASDVLSYGPVVDRYGIPLASLVASSAVLDTLATMAGNPDFIPLGHPGGAIGGKV